MPWACLYISVKDLDSFPFGAAKVAGIIEVTNGALCIVGNVLCIVMGMDKTYQAAGITAGVMVREIKCQN